MTKKKKLIIIIAAVVALLAIVATTIILVVVKNKEHQKIDPTVNAVVAEGVYYEDNYLSTVTLVLAEDSTRGTLSWVNPNLELLAGTHEYEWKFVPEDAKRYNEKTWKIEIFVNTQTIISLEIKTKPNKLSGYQAYQTLDTTGLVLKVSYDSGNVNERSENIEVIYESTDADFNPLNSFRYGDTKVTIKYKTFTVDLLLDAPVEKYRVETPKQSARVVYTGTAQTVPFETSMFYVLTEGTNVGTDAGSDYKAKFTLTDTINCVWKDTESDGEILASFTIDKAEQTVTENVYNGQFDGRAHYSTVQTNLSGDVYYSYEVLTAENYQTIGSLNPADVSWTNVDENGKVVYYYAAGNSNYNDKAGELKIIITRANSRTFVNNAFAIFNDKNVEVPESFASVLGANNSQVQITDKIRYVYYTSYESESVNTKTNYNNSGATSDGGAPKNKGSYYVVAYFEGNDTYLASNSDQQVFTIGDAPEGFYGESKNDLYWVSGNSEGSAENQGIIYFCTKLANMSFLGFYVESTIFGNGYISIVNGKYILNSSNGKTYSIQINGAQTDISVTNTEDSIDKFALTKFSSPVFIGEYHATNALDSSKTDVLKIYADNGLIYFEMYLYYNSKDQILKTDETAQATLSYGTASSGRVRLSFTYTTEDGQIQFQAYYYEETQTVVLVNYYYPSINGEVFAKV